MAVSGLKVLRAIVKALRAYEISTAVTLSPNMYDAFPMQDILTDRVQIASPELVAEDAEIFADETSEIIIEEGVEVSSDVVILASDHSTIRIGKDTFLDKRAHVFADEASVLNIGVEGLVGEQCSIVSEKHSELVMGDRVHVDSRNIMGASERGVLFLGEETTIGENGWFSATAGGEIHLGNDNMLSLFIKMAVGNHELLDQKTGRLLTNRAAIHTEGHVWIGIGSTLLPGAHLGEGSVVGASSVVTKPFPPHCTIAGNPARVLRERIFWQREAIDHGTGV